MQITLDGYVAGPNDEMDWIRGSEDVWEQMFKDLESVDTILLGRKMYPGYAEYWQAALNDPSADANLVKYARTAEKTPHIVFSRGDFTPSWANTRVAHDPAKEIARLKKQDGKDMVVWGGAEFASQLVDLGLIDEFRLSVDPVLLGRGKRLFHDQEKRNSLRLIDAKATSPGLVILKYEKVV